MAKDCLTSLAMNTIKFQVKQREFKRIMATNCFHPQLIPTNNPFE
jgi:hypothetical protein